jgi:protein-S-isoprenylcysteine O-methyltransferase Ste14
MNRDNQAVKAKAWLGLFWLVGIMALCLFAAAGTVRFWQGWIYLMLFAASSTGITLFLMSKDMELLKRRLQAGPAAERDSTQKIIQALASFAFISILLVPGFDHRFGWSRVPLYLIITGDFFVVLGFLIVFFVFKENCYTSAVIEVVENQRVISTGPYAVVRHPMYSGASLMLLFTPLALGSFWDLLCAGLLIAIVIWRLIEEEKFLIQKLPQYEAYCKKTRFRFIPWIW